jgi:predicted nucleic acid-binding protein
MRPEEEDKTLLFLTRFETSSVDAAIVDSASVLYRKWAPSCGMDINDAILAATVEQEGGILYTLNVKHYPMKTFIVEKAF